MCEDNEGKGAKYRMRGRCHTCFRVAAHANQAADAHKHARRRNFNASSRQCNTAGQGATQDLVRQRGPCYMGIRGMRMVNSLPERGGEGFSVLHILTH